MVGTCHTHHVSLCSITSYKKYTCQPPTTCPSLSPQTRTSHNLTYLLWASLCPSLESGTFSSDLISEQNCHWPFLLETCPGRLSSEFSSHVLLAAFCSYLYMSVGWFHGPAICAISQSSMLRRVMNLV